MEMYNQAPSGFPTNQNLQGLPTVDLERAIVPNILSKFIFPTAIALTSLKTFGYYAMKLLTAQDILQRYSEYRKYSAFFNCSITPSKSLGLVREHLRLLLLAALRFRGNIVL